MEICKKCPVIKIKVIKHLFLIRFLTFWILSIVRGVKCYGDFQIVLERFGGILMLQVSRRSENNVPGNNMSVNNLLVNQIGAWWRLFVEKIISDSDLTETTQGTLKPSSTGMKNV